MAIALPVRLTEGSASISAVVSCTDSCRITLTDNAAVFISFSVSDSSAVVASDQASAVATISVFDSHGIAISESTSVIDPNTATITASDAVTVQLASESSTLGATSVVQDTPSIGFADSVSSLQVFTGQSTNNVSVSDSLTVRLNGIEPPAPTITVSVTDVLSAGLSDIVTFTVSVVSSDTLAVRGTDTAATPVVSARVTDSLSVNILEPGDQQTSFGVIDGVAVGASDAAPLISGSFSFNVTDSLTIQQSELTAFGTSTVGTSDSIRTVGSELIVNSASVFASDGLRASATEVVSTFKAILSTDSLAAQLTDSAAPIFNSFVGLNVSDSLAVQCSESISTLISFLQQLSVADSLAIANVEGSADQSVSLSATDQLSSQANGLLDIWNAQSITESVTVGTIESGLAIPIVSVNVSAFADDTILGSADGVASVSIVYEAFEYTVSDTCNVQGTDASRLQVGQYWEDELLVAAGDVASDTAVANASPETWNGHAGTEHRNDKPKPWKYLLTEKLNW